MVSQRRLIDTFRMKRPTIKDAIAFIRRGWAICANSVVWLYDDATVTAENCTIIRVNCPNARILGSGNTVVDYDNIPQDLFQRLIKEGVLNAV